jgi:hypothetical protein
MKKTLYEVDTDNGVLKTLEGDEYIINPSDLPICCTDFVTSGERPLINWTVLANRSCIRRDLRRARVLQEAFL